MRALILMTALMMASSISFATGPVDATACGSSQSLDDDGSNFQANNNGPNEDPSERTDEAL